MSSKIYRHLFVRTEVQVEDVDAELDLDRGVRHHQPVVAVKDRRPQDRQLGRGRDVANDDDGDDDDERDDKHFRHFCSAVVAQLSHRSPKLNPFISESFVSEKGNKLFRSLWALEKM